MFLPDKGEKVEKIAIFTHGYTDHKGSLLPWGTQLAARNIPVIIFDLPGHFLASDCEIESFEEFSQESFRLFSKANKKLYDRLELDNSPYTLLGGHSLGALLALKAAADDYFAKTDISLLAVGLGLNSPKEGTIFYNQFREDMANIRSQLVSKHLNLDAIMPWFNDEKKLLKLSNKKIHLISGRDDFVAPPNEVENLAKFLKNQNNEVNQDVCNRLPHHMPELAVKAFLKLF